MISCLKNVAMIDILDLPAPDSIASIFQGFSAANKDDLLAATRASRNETSLITVERCVDTICELAKAVSGDAGVEVRRGLGLVAAVGTELGIPEVHESLRTERIRSYAVVEGNSDRSVLVRVEVNDFERTAKVLHGRLVST
jgi:aspartokinase